MKLGVITDVHNNAVALEAVLNYLVEAGCQEIFCCGDMIGIGPSPEETVQLIKTYGKITCVVGNHETYLIKRITTTLDARLSEVGKRYHL
ncbi:MAG TPA: hypothetical protein DCY20_02595 [Firmicutes bacterium]|nr:hypothetical protein [Bacillota bacterium]